MKQGFFARLRRAALTGAKDETGSISVLSIQMLLASLIMGGLAVDVGNAFSTRTQLQVAADAAAHAALWSREWNSADVAKAKAITIVTNMMPTSRYGNVLIADDIVFGKWDPANEKFTADAASKLAVFVSTKRYESRNNSLSTWFLDLAGLDQWDVASGAVFETYLPGCATEGFLAEGRIDTQSNNHYLPGFCVHSQTHVEVNSNNIFDTGSIVSMPDKVNVVLPSSGYVTNSGLKDALRDGSYAIRILDRIGMIETGLLNPQHAQYGVMTTTSPFYRSYITSKVIVKVAAPGPTVLDPGKFKGGRIHHIDCKNDNTHKTINGNWFKKMILVTDCQIDINNDSILEDAVILTTNDNSLNAIKGGSYITLGKDDHCSAGGGVQLVTYGTISFSSNTKVYGSQMIAAKDIYLTADGSGVEGIHLVAGGEISVTSNGTYGYCAGAGMENNYDTYYFRMVA